MFVWVCGGVCLCVGCVFVCGVYVGVECVGVWGVCVCVDVCEWVVGCVCVCVCERERESIETRRRHQKLDIKIFRNSVFCLSVCLSILYNYTTMQGAENSHTILSHASCKQPFSQSVLTVTVVRPALLHCFSCSLPRDPQCHTWLL